MPTPSSNSLPDAASSRSINFSTCPDDIQQQHSTSPWQSHDAIQDPSHLSTDMGVRHAADTTATLTDDAPRAVQGLATEDALLYERASTNQSDGPSSRSSTMSPPPQSTITQLASSVPIGSDSDATKIRDAEIGSQLSREPSNSTRQATDSDSVSHTYSRRSSPSREFDSTDADVLEQDLWSPSMGLDYSSMRSIPSSPSSFLRAGSRFHGTQQSERQVYDVQVEIKHVDMRESFLCGYLRIQGLTEDHPTLTTYFEGEIIGSKYNFLTQHENWGANSKVDLSHWAKFTAFRPFLKQARKGPVAIRDVAQRETIFMRWKEHFLVPDHRVRTITGASFEGFYYICFNQVKGEVSGIYFHSKSEKFQQLELKHVPDRGCFAAAELR